MSPQRIILPVDLRGSIARRDLDRLEQLPAGAVNFRILGPEWANPGHAITFRLWRKDGNNIWQPSGEWPMVSAQLDKSGALARTFGFGWDGSESDLQGEAEVLNGPFDWGLGIEYGV